MLFKALRCISRRSLATSSSPSVAKLRAQTRINQIDSTTPFSKYLTDSFHRKHDYLRISLTEKCNLRCFYCMPSEGIELSPDGKLLSNGEILRLATLFVKTGVTKIRLTGGEPTVRKGIGEIIGELNKLKQYGLRSIGMTSNGIALHRRLPQLVENGLTHLNLSLDTLDPFKFELITRRRGHDAVLKTLQVALSSSLASVKINVVVIKGLNDSEVLDFVDMTKYQPISVRFIEFMPFAGNKWDKNKLVPSSDLLALIQARHPAAVRAPDELNDTARSWTIPGYKGSFGFISSMSDHFCATCNRLRLTADGQIKVCLFDAKEVSLRDEMRMGASDDDLLKIVGQAVVGKMEKHAGMEDINVTTNRPMILIGDGPRRHVYGNLPRQNTMTFQTLRESFKPSHVRLYGTSSRLSHLDEQGRASMVDVSEKHITKRIATASGRIFVSPEAYELVTSPYPVEPSTTDDSSEGEVGKARAKARRKGDALTVAQLAGIMAAKQTSSLIPLCHPFAISKIDVSLTPELPRSPSGHDSKTGSRHSIVCTATVTCEGKTGVEMEALMAVSVGLLTVWDMLKAVAGREMEVGEIMVVHKSGGQSGDFSREIQ